MPAYIIADVTINDLNTYKQYQSLTPDTIAKYGGKFIVRGAEHTILEGTNESGRIVVLQFEDKASAQRWYDSPEYREARDIRQTCSTSNIILIEGV